MALSKLPSEKATLAKRAELQIAPEVSASTRSIHRFVAPMRLVGKTALSVDTENSREPERDASRARSSTASALVSTMRIRLKGSRSERTCFSAAKLKMTWNGPLAARKRMNAAVPNATTDVAKSSGSSQRPDRSTRTRSARLFSFRSTRTSAAGLSPANELDHGRADRTRGTDHQNAGGRARRLERLVMPFDVGCKDGSVAASDQR